MKTRQKKNLYKKEKKKSNREKKHKTKSHPNKKRDHHHVYPRSRGKRKALGKFKTICCSLILKTEIKKHGAWHHIFYNLFPEEAITLIKKAFRKDNKTPEKIISFIKQKIIRDRSIGGATTEDLFAWEKIFGEEKRLWRIIKIILENWSYRGINATIERKKVSALKVFLKKMPPKIRTKIRYIISRCKRIKITEFRKGEVLKIN